MELDGQIINCHFVFILKSVSRESTVPTLVGIRHSCFNKFMQIQSQLQFLKTTEAHAMAQRCSRHHRDFGSILG